MAKSVPLLQDLCNCVLETLRMTIDEKGMDIQKNPDFSLRLVGKLDQVFDLTVSSSQAVKMMSKKAHLKKNSQLG